MVGPTTGLAKRGVLSALRAAVRTARGPIPTGRMAGSTHGLGAKYHDMARDYIDLGDRTVQRTLGLGDSLLFSNRNRASANKLGNLDGAMAMREGADDDLYRVSGAIGAGTLALAPLLVDRGINPHSVGWANSRDDGGFDPDPLTTSIAHTNAMNAELNDLTPEETQALIDMVAKQGSLKAVRSMGASPWAIPKNSTYAYMNKEDPTWSDGDRNRR